MILRHQPDNLAARADHDLGIKGKRACQFGAELRPRDRPPDDEGARRADVDGIEVLQLVDERGRPEGPVTADVDPSQKNHECHAFPYLARSITPKRRHRRVPGLREEWHALRSRGATPRTA